MGGFDCDVRDMTPTGGAWGGIYQGVFIMNLFCEGVRFRVDAGGIRLRVDKKCIRFRVCFICVLLGIYV